MSKSKHTCGCPKTRTGGDAPCGQCSDNDLSGEFCNICGHDVFCCYDYKDEKKAKLRMEIENKTLDKKE